MIRLVYLLFFFCFSINPINRRNAGGMIPGMPGLDVDHWEVPRANLCPGVMLTVSMVL